MDAAAHYRHLAQLGRDEFLGASAPAALVRSRRAAVARSAGDDGTLTVEHRVLDGAHWHDQAAPEDDEEPDALELFPLIKKPGASFPDRITIGRTANNDLGFDEVSISRFHAYLRSTDGGKRWVIADAGSKNGSWLDAIRLEPRKERSLTTRAVVRLGDVELMFYLALDLYVALGGR